MPPTMKWLGLIVLPHSVILSFYHSIIILFLIIISTTVAHIQIKIDTWMCLMNIHVQVEFEFGLGPMILDRVMPLELTVYKLFVSIDLVVPVYRHSLVVKVLYCAFEL